MKTPTEMDMADTNHQSENKMGTMPVKRLVISMSLPMMISMLVQALYNIVDSIFVARIGEDALTAVSMAFPIQSLMIALSGGMGVGVNAMLSRALGEKKQGRVNAAAMNGLFLSFCNFVVFVVVGLTCIKPFYRVQSDSPSIVQYGCDYLSIVCCISLGLFFAMTSERLLQATGNTIYSMVTQVVGAMINIIFDPILIFGLLGFPALGVKGAAIATVAGQVCAAATGIIINIKANSEIHFSLRAFRPSVKIIAEIYKVGLPSIIMQSIGSIMVFGFNKILMAFSSTAVAVFGVYFKLQSFIFMPVFGLNNGLVPIVAYNYGAQKRRRLISAVRFTALIALLVMLAGVMLFELFPGQFLVMFSASENMLDMGKVALRIIAIHFPLAAFGIVFGSVFQALGKAFYSMIISICRQLAVLLPAAFILARLTDNVNAVWWAFPIAETVAIVFSVSFMIKIYNSIIKNIADNP